jgi:hypothetical protein
MQGLPRGTNLICASVLHFILCASLMLFSSVPLALLLTDLRNCQQCTAYFEAVYAFTMVTSRIIIMLADSGSCDSWNQLSATTG